MTRRVAMARIVEDLQTFAARDFPKEDVDHYLAETLVEPAELDRYVGYCDERYMRHLVHKDRDFELLVICWGSGHRAPIHGHEGELCWARVERGTLRFSSYDVVSDDPLQLRLIDQPVDGSMGFVDGPAEIHAVENPAEFGERAASLHLYSKPYDECDIYDSEMGPRRRVQLGYDSIKGEPVERATP